MAWWWPPQRWAAGVGREAQIALAPVASVLWRHSLSGYLDMLRPHPLNFPNNAKHDTSVTRPIGKPLNCTLQQPHLQPPLCSLYPSTRDPSQSLQPSSPTPHHPLNTRTTPQPRSRSSTFSSSCMHTQLVRLSSSILLFPANTPQTPRVKPRADLFPPSSKLTIQR